jgi:multiple sugar transport system permease protein
MLQDTVKPVACEKPSPADGKQRRMRLTLQGREGVYGYLFASPVILGLLIFTVVPLFSAMYYSFTDYDLLTKANWVGFANYVRLWHDPLWYKSLSVTLLYALTSVPLGLIGSLGLALLLNREVIGVRFWRAVFYLPVVFPAAGASLIWLTMFNANNGLFNTILTFFHLPPYTWVSEPETALPSMIIFSLWGMGGSMLIWISGLRSIPTDLYDAARVDGANAWHQFWSVTLPMLSPVLLFNLIIGIISSLQIFTQAEIVTAGGPLHATFFIVLFIYQEAFQDFRMGYASAIAWMLFLLIALLTALVLRTSSNWVYYAGGDRNE